MSQGVFTPELRLRFIEETEFISISSFPSAGPNTPYPVEVTQKQLSEILYQVRRSELTGGYVDASTDSGMVIELTETASPENLWYSSPDNKSGGGRGYAFPNVTSSFMPGGVDPLPAGIDKYFETNYHLSYEDYEIIPIYEAKNEYAIWHPVLAGTYPSIFGEYLITGLSNSIAVESIVDPSDSTLAIPADYYGFAYSGQSFDDDYDVSSGATFFDVAFRNTAVFRDIDGSGNPFSPANKIFLGVEVFFAAYIDPEGSFDMFSAFSWETGTGWEEVFNLRIELKDSVLTIPLFSRETPDSFSDLVLTATEWWPYAKDSPAVPVWNAETGARL